MFFSKQLAILVQKEEEEERFCFRFRCYSIYHPLLQLNFTEICLCVATIYLLVSRYSNFSMNVK